MSEHLLLHCTSIIKNSFFCSIQRLYSFNFVYSDKKRSYRKFLYSLASNLFFFKLSFYHLLLETKLVFYSRFSEKKLKKKSLIFRSESDQRRQVVSRPRPRVRRQLQPRPDSLLAVLRQLGRIHETISRY